MDSQTKALFEARAQVIKALGHPTRLFVVNELSKSERCVCELQQMIGSDMSTISKHLSVLKPQELLPMINVATRYSILCWFPA